MRFVCVVCVWFALAGQSAAQQMFFLPVNLGARNSSVLFARSQDPQVLCQNPVELDWWTTSAEALEKVNRIWVSFGLQTARNRLQESCPGFTVSRFNLRVVIGPRYESSVELKRVWVENKLGFSILNEDVSAEDKLLNTSGESLNTDGLVYKAFYDDLFYRRFDNVRQQGYQKNMFADIYIHFLKLYGETHAADLHAPAIEYTRAVTVRRDGFAVRNVKNVWRIEERFKPSLETALDDVFAGDFAVGNNTSKDVEELMSRHPVGSPALRLLLDNMFLYATSR